MTNSFLSKNWQRVALLCVVVLVLGCGRMLSRPRTQPMTITVNNSSSRAITHLYLAAADSDDWGPDLLADSPIASGASFTVDAASCDGSGVKVVAEDQDGCFVAPVVACSGNAVTITNDMARNCGS